MDQQSKSDPLAAGFVLAAAGEDRWYLDTPFAPPGWVARRRSSPGRGPFPGTALRRGEVWLEIVDAQPRASGPSAGMRYTLAPWPEAEVFRATADLTRAACLALAKDHAERARRQRRAKVLTLLAPVVGLLPGDVQLHLETNYGTSATRTTAISAAVVLLVATVATGVGFAASRGLHFGSFQPLARSLAPWWIAFVYFAFESVVRLRVAWSADMPCGSAFVAVPVMIALGLRHGRPSSSQTTAPAVVHRDAVWRQARDDVKTHPDGRLEVHSLLPKDHWTMNVTGIAYRGQVYRMTDRSTVATANGSRHRFVLSPVPDDALVQAHMAYEPEEVRALFREQQRVRTAMWIESVPFLWGLLDESLQHQLAEIYRYAPQRWTQFTIRAGAGLGLFNVLAPWLRASTGLLDLAVVLVGVLMLWDTWLRHRAFRAGLLRPSLFGLPFAGTARRALRWAPTEDSIALG